MPRRKGSASTTSAILQIRRPAGSILAKLRKDIHAKEIELAQLPKQFKASHVRRVHGLKDKRPIFAAITRWIEAGLAKRKTRGLYEKGLARQPHRRLLMAHCRAFSELLRHAPLGDTRAYTRIAEVGSHSEAVERAGSIRNSSMSRLASCGRLPRTSCACSAR